MPGRSITLSFLVGIFVVLCGCTDGEGKETKVDRNETIYQHNNSLAIQRVKAISSRQISEDSFVERFKVVHISDPHISAKSLDNHYSSPTNLLQSVRFANQPELKIDAFVCTGDYINNGKKKEISEHMLSFSNNFYSKNYVPSFLCTGNHDCNIVDSSTTQFMYPDEINAFLFAPSNTLRNSKDQDNYYYADVVNPQGGYIRIIALDMLDQIGKEYNTMIYASYTQAQIDWLCNVALKENMTPQHSILVLNHYPFQPYSSGHQTYLCDGDYVHSWNMIPEIIEAFRSRTSLNKTYPNKLIPEKTLTVNADFGGSTGDFVCYLGGHAHCFAIFEIMKLENRVPELSPQKMILCTNQAPTEMGKIYNKVPREDFTPESNSFNIYAIDTHNKQVHVTFFGAFKPANDEKFPEIIVFDYL